MKQISFEHLPDLADEGMQLANVQELSCSRFQNGWPKWQMAEQSNSVVSLLV